VHQVFLAFIFCKQNRVRILIDYIRNQATEKNAQNRMESK
jgi:hypothetical protein